MWRIIEMSTTVIAQISNNGQILLHQHPWWEVGTNARVAADLHVYLHKFALVCCSKINADIKESGFPPDYGISTAEPWRAQALGSSCYRLFVWPWMCCDLECVVTLRYCVFSSGNGNNKNTTYHIMLVQRLSELMCMKDLEHCLAY